MRTDQLVADLTRDLAPVRVLARPWIRTLVWAGIAVAYLAALVAIMTVRDDLGVRVREPRFVIEQVAAFLTGVTAAAAALASVVPGYRRHIVLLPLASGLLWLGAVAAAAVPELWYGAGALPPADWRCVATILVGSLVPGAAMLVMVRRGAPLQPRLTAALGALAAAGLGNLGVCVFHPHASSAIVLFWHCGTVLALAAVAWLVGVRTLRWPPAARAARVP